MYVADVSIRYALLILLKARGGLEHLIETSTDEQVRNLYIHNLVLFHSGVDLLGFIILSSARLLIEGSYNIGYFQCVTTTLLELIIIARGCACIMAAGKWPTFC